MGTMVAFRPLDSFVCAYMETALWSSMDDDAPLDQDHTVNDLARSTRRAMIADCEHFTARVEEIGAIPTQEMAHDFWLTRNHHGAGFWDGDWPEPLATQLTELSRAFGGADLYVGDDGLIYQHGRENG